MKFIKKLRRIWRYIGLLWNDEPVRTWRKTEDGKYACDGDCGRWSLHGVCTCGIAHHFKYQSKTHLIHRDNVSWHREGQTEQVMMDVPYENECPHGLSWNDNCERCRVELDRAMRDLFKEFNNEDPTVSS